MEQWILLPRKKSLKWWIIQIESLSCKNTLNITHKCLSSAITAAHYKWPACKQVFSDFLSTGKPVKLLLFVVITNTLQSRWNISFAYNYLESSRSLMEVLNAILVHMCWLQLNWHRRLVCIIAARSLIPCCHKMLKHMRNNSETSRICAWVCWRVCLHYQMQVRWTCAKDNDLHTHKSAVSIQVNEITARRLTGSWGHIPSESDLVFFCLSQTMIDRS